MKLNSVIVHPCRAWGGTVRVPGDKSISHRIALLGAMSRGVTAAAGFLRSEDSVTLLRALRQLGVASAFEGSTLRVQGLGGKLQAPAAALDMGNSGTGLRLLAGILAGQDFTTTLTGDASLSSRPMRRIQEPLERMGARVELLGPDGRPPVRITAGHLHGIEYALPVASAQVKSCVLLAALYAEGLTTVVEPKPTRDHTERLLAALGVPVRVDGLRITVQGYGPDGAPLQGRSWVVPGDFSSAAFWITAVAGRPGWRIAIDDVGLNPRRSALLRVLQRMGARIEIEPAASGRACEEMGRITVSGTQLAGTEVSPEEVPDLIDELPLVAVAGALAKGQTVIRGAAELRVKESDRIAVMSSNLRLLGVRVDELPDGMIVQGARELRHRDITIESHGDHRVPMAFAVLALTAGGPLCLRDVDCVAKSYPQFWDDLEKLGGRIEHRGCD